MSVVATVVLLGLALTQPPASSGGRRARKPAASPADAVSQEDAAKRWIREWTRHHDDATTTDLPPRQQPLRDLADLVSFSHDQLQQGQQQQRERRPQKQTAPPPLAGIVTPTAASVPPPSVTAVDDDNDSSMNAWVVLGKPPIREQMSLELAVRVSATARLLASTSTPPDVICFCGGEADGMMSHNAAKEQSAPGRALIPGRLSSAHLSYHYFLTACEALSLDTSNIHFILEPHQEVREGVLSTAIALRARQRQHISSQRERSDTRVITEAPINVRLLSTDHLLHRLSDMDGLTPQHSPLLPLRDLHADISFEPTASPFAYSTDADAKRQARYLRLAGQLTVLLTNLRGVEACTDFWHTDNTRRLVDTRAELINTRWKLVPSHGGQRATYSPLSHGSGGNGEEGPNEVLCELACVEGALAALGKVQALMEPLVEDPIHNTVPIAELRVASEQLRNAIASLRLADPDRPITPEEGRELMRGGLEAYLQARSESGVELWREMRVKE